MGDPDIRKKFDDNGLHPATLSRADYVAFLMARRRRAVMPVRARLERADAVVSRRKNTA
jgi:hypothetical protein